MRLREYCQYCDEGPNGFNKCKKAAKYSEIYFEEKKIIECRKVSIEGLQADMTKNGIKFYMGWRSINLKSKSGLTNLIKGIEVGKEMRWDIFNTPEISPIKKVLGEEKYNELCNTVKNF